MDRVKRTCVVGSVVFHTLTLALLFLSPVLLAKREEKIEVIDLIPSEIVDQIMAPPAPIAPPSPPNPTPPKPSPPKPKPPKLKPTPPDPSPPKAKPVEIVKPKPKPVEMVKPKPPKPNIKVNLKPTKRSPNTQAIRAQQAATERASKEAEKRQAAVNRSINNLKSNLSERTSVNVPQGRYAAANYVSLIRRKYVDATIHPGTISGDPVVKVQLIIARNGNVISARIINGSGMASWDRAVQKALDRVKRIAPFPAGMSDPKKTFSLNFNSRSFQ